MQVVKVLPKGQITLPKEVRARLRIEVGDTLLVEERKGELVFSRGKTLMDLKGTLPDPGMTIEEMREKAITEAVRSRG